eukprot:s305_g23.t1
METADLAREPKAKAHPVPPPRGHELEKGEMKREQGKVELRGAERLAVARERHKNFRARQLREREAAAEALERDISKAQDHLWRTQVQTNATLEEMESQQGVYQAQENDALWAKQRAQQRVFSSREESAQHSAWTETQVNDAVLRADEAVEAQRADVKSLVHLHRSERNEFKEKLQKEVSARQAETKAFVEDILLQTNSCLRQKESERHHAVMHCDKVAEMHQTTRTQAQARMKLHDEKSKQQVKERRGWCEMDLEQLTYQLRVRSDEALAEKISQTTGHLGDAKAFCAKVREEMAEEIQLAKQNASRIEEEAAMNTRNEQRKLEELESKALDSFINSIGEAQSSRQETEAKRKAMQVELDELHSKYQDLHDATQAKTEGGAGSRFSKHRNLLISYLMKSIMELWREDRASMEQQIGSCEARRQEAFEAVTKSMKERTGQLEVRSKELIDNCSHVVVECQRHNEDQVFACYEAAVDVARSEEQHAEQTLKAAQQWKAQIQGIEERADEEIEAYQLRAQHMEAQMEKDAQAQVRLSRGLHTRHMRRRRFTSPKLPWHGQGCARRVISCGWPVFMILPKVSPLESLTAKSLDRLPQGRGCRGWPLNYQLATALIELRRWLDEVEEADQKVAEVKKRDWQLRDRIESLEEHEANTEGQLKWMRSELDNRTSELEVATKQLTSVKAENATLNSNMAKVEQELKASKEEQLKSHAEAGKRASISAWNLVKMEAIEESENLHEWHDYDDDESFASDSGESLEAATLAPKLRIEAGFRGANGIFIDFVSRKTRSRHPLLVMLLGDAKSRQHMARRASRSEAGLKMLKSYKARSERAASWAGEHGNGTFHK